MAGKSNFHANLPILDGKNWDTWVKQMKVIFIVQEADEQVNTILDPLPANATEQQRTTFREALKKDSKALFLIHQCVDSKVFEKIADATTSKDAWDILQKSYGGDSKVKKVKLQALKRQFELLEMKNDEAVAEYFTRVETLTNQMKNCGSTLSEEEMVEKVLRTLTHKFDHIVVTIEQTKDLSEIKMEDLQSTLEAHELKHGERNHGKEEEQALFVKFKKYQDEKKKWQNKKCSKKGKESVEDKPESSEKEGGGQNTKKDKSTIQCYSCNKYGHYAKDDVSFMVIVTDEEESEAHMTENDNGSDQGPLLMMPITEDEFGKQEGWYLDTCCSNHMTSNKEWLVNYDSLKKSTIRFADSRTVKSEGIGDMLIKGKDGNQVLITGVMYVPNVPSNILSIEQLVEKGFTVSLGNNQMEVYNVGNKMVFCASLSQSRIVQVKFENSNSEVLIEEENDKSIKISRTGGASKHTSKESGSEHQKVHISEDVIMNEVHINEDSESDCNAETEVEADVEAPEAEVSTVEANVETEVISTRKSQVPARWLECELADDSRVSKEGELMQCALLVDEPVTKSKTMTNVGIVSCFLRNKLLRIRGLMLHHKKYAGEILRRFNMVENPTIIKKVARCLRYLYKSRPDICLVKGLVSRLKENTRKSHMNNVVRRILRYIAGTLEFGIFLPKSARNAKPEIEIGWLSDVNWCGDKVVRRSTSGYVFKFQNAPVSWCSKKQSVIALSSCEAEYVAGSLAACQANWLQSLLSEMKIIDNITVMLKIDNKSTINLAKNPVSHGKSKHIETRFHFLRDQVNKGKLSLEYCSTNDQQADILTKAVKKDQFLKLRREMGIVSFDSLN
ncbi:hypothetical protein TSUD_24940 [Trifolium subterraneum]|uniref:Retrovirus-related Pol polyprotein from transposon TNT 1-94-like beta-barrel domain-containing protein n=1 Tax=Trifolium subterraneum TaxID=3900 RepID=A0A2Z6PA49_TRISU|nr:hypothetical protein TSUD_24940 [Trifolium subterraneum]